LALLTFTKGFIQEFLDITYSFFDITRSNSIWIQNFMQQVIFDVLKYTITMVLVLIFSDTSVLFCIKADSSDFTTREVFSQVFKEDDK